MVGEPMADFHDAHGLERLLVELDSRPAMGRLGSYGRCRCHRGSSGKFLILT
jgi:hypothetical protein